MSSLARFGVVRRPSSGFSADCAVCDGTISGGREAYKWDCNGEKCSASCHIGCALRLFRKCIGEDDFVGVKCPTCGEKMSDIDREQILFYNAMEARDENDRLWEESKKLMRDNVTLSEKNDVLTKKNDVLVKKCNALEADNAQLNIGVRELQNSVALLRSENAELRSDNAALRADNARLRAINARLSASNGRIVADAERSRAEQADVNRELMGKITLLTLDMERMRRGERW